MTAEHIYWEFVNDGVTVNGERRNCIECVDVYNRYLIELGSVRKPNNFSEEDDVDMMGSYDED